MQVFPACLSKCTSRAWIAGLHLNGFMYAPCGIYDADGKNNTYYNILYYHIVKVALFFLHGI